MKNAVLIVILGLLVGSTAFVVFDHVGQKTESVEMNSDEDYGGPLRKLFKRLRKKQVEHQFQK